MRIYYGNSGRNYYIMCRDFEEIRVFDMFGNVIGDTGGVSSCSKWIEVDCISILGVSSNNCEILLNDKKATINDTIYNITSKIRARSGYLGIMFNIPHYDEVGKFNQVLFVYRKGELDKEIISKMFSVSVWKPL